MHPFKVWLDQVSYPVPFSVGKDSTDWFDFASGQSFKEFLVHNDLRIQNINRFHIIHNAPLKTLQIYADQFYGKPLARQHLHTDLHVLTAERKRYQVLTQTNDLIAINMCHHDFLNQVQYWVLRHQASLNEILMNMASIIIVRSLTERIITKTLNLDELKTLNGGDAISWNDVDALQQIKDKLMNLIYELLHFTRVAFKNLTPEEIKNP